MGLGGTLGAGLGSFAGGPIGAVGGASFGGSMDDSGAGFGAYSNLAQANGAGMGGEVTGGMLNYGGADIQLQHPGLVDPLAVNPYANQYLQHTNDLYSMFSNSAAGGAFNPSFYNQMMQNQQNQMTTGLGNQYARMGLSGSSAEMGGMANAIQSNQMNWMNRQQSDQMRAMQGLQSLNNTGYQQTMGIQNQYGDFQDAYSQDIMSLLGINQSDINSNNQLEGQIIGSIIGAGGMAAGGAMKGG